MNKRRLAALTAGPGLAVAGFLLSFWLLAQATVAATPGEALCSGDWVVETVDRDGGEFTSLALAATYPYTPHISYHNITNQSLRHASLSGTTWLSETADPHGGQRVPTSLALVPTYPYTPCISYHDHWEYWAVKFACQNDITWTVQIVAGGHRQGEVGVSLALEPIYPYKPHISYGLLWGVNDLRRAYLSSTAWMSGTWVNETVDSTGRVGGHSSIALEATAPYTPHISYCGYFENESLNYAWLSGTTWLSQTVNSEGCSYTSLALDSNGSPHISYYDNTSGVLKYVRLNGTTWLSETVDSTGTSSNVRLGTSLELDRAGVPYVSYYDAIKDDLNLAYFNGTVWITQTVDSEGDVGSWSSLALDQAGCPHISYYDATNKSLKYAYIPPGVIYLPVIMKNYH